MINDLLNAQPSLEAAELESLMSATMLPFQKTNFIRRIFRRLRRQIDKPYLPPKPKVEVVEHDPDKAADYFRRLGWKVKNGDAR